MNRHRRGRASSARSGTDELTRAAMTALLTVALVALLGCSAARTPTPTSKPTLTVIDLTPPQTPPAHTAPAPLELIAGLWVPGTSADTALADEVNRAWTERDVDALDQIYAADFQLMKGWELALPDDLDAIRAAVADTANTYQRLSPVTVTTDAVTGLAPLLTGWRYVHWVVQIHGVNIDSVSAVDEDGLIHLGYLDDHLDASVRLRDGFPVFSILLGSPGPA